MVHAPQVRPMSEHWWQNNITATNSNNHGSARTISKRRQQPQHQKVSHYNRHGGETAPTESKRYERRQRFY